MRAVHRWLACAAAATALTGCLVPEKFTASVTLKPDGSYNYQYDGTAMHAMAAAAIKQLGRLPPQDEAGLKQEADKAAKAKGVRKIRYLGAGRYELSVNEDVLPGQQVQVMRLVTVSRAKDGVFTIAPVSLTQKDKDALKEIGIKPEGTVQVRLPANAQVISHNAAGTPGFFSKGYSWRIGTVGQQPGIRFKLGD